MAGISEHTRHTKTRVVAVLTRNTGDLADVGADILDFGGGDAAGACGQLGWGRFWGKQMLGERLELALANENVLVPCHDAGRIEYITPIALNVPMLELPR